LGTAYYLLPSPKHIPTIRLAEVEKKRYMKLIHTFLLSKTVFPYQKEPRTSLILLLFLGKLVNNEKSLSFCKIKIGLFPLGILSIYL
jgi:hypothetical protein